MVKTLETNEYLKISEKRASEIPIGVLEALEAGCYAEQEGGVVFTRADVPAAQFRVAQDEPFPSAGYMTFTEPLYQMVRDTTGPTHFKVLRLAVSNDASKNLMPDHFPASLWTEELINFELHGRRDKALDLMFREIDALLRRGELEKCNALLESVDAAKTSTNLLLGYLSITLAADNLLPSRRHLLQRVEQRLAAHPKREKLLAGLRGNAAAE